MPEGLLCASVKTEKDSLFAFFISYDTQYEEEARKELDEWNESNILNAPSEEEAISNLDVALNHLAYHFTHPTPMHHFLQYAK